MIRRPPRSPLLPYTTHSRTEEKQEEKYIRMTTQPPEKLILKLAFPTIISMLITSIYNMADTYFVSQINTSASAAVGVSYSLMSMIQAFGFTLGMGGGNYLSRVLGTRDTEKAERIASTAFYSAIAVGAVLAVVGLLFLDPLVKILGATDTIAPYAKDYAKYILMAAPIMTGALSMNNLLRFQGLAVYAMVGITVGGVLNMILDPILIFGFDMGIAGAAIATAAAQAVSVVIGLIILRRRGLPFPFSVKNIRFNPSDTVTILRLGSPIALQDALTSVSFLIITAIINSLGLIESAAIGVGEKIVVFIMLIPIAFMSSVSAFVAQNIGAGKVQRARRAMLCAMGISLVFGVAMFVFSFFRGDILAAVFSNDGEVVAACAEYMKSYAIDCLLVCVQFCFMGYFNGCGKTLFVMIQGIAAAFLVRIPFSYFMSRRVGVTMLQIGFASPLATLLSIILCIIYYFVTERRSVEAAE